MSSLWLTGAVGTMITEEWTFLEGLYFSTYALLTVGHGDLAPSTNSGIWFVTFWLPFNILFVTLYLGSVAHIFVRISNGNVACIEKKLREQEIQKVRMQEADASDKCTGEKDASPRTFLIKQNSIGRMFLSDGSDISTGRDLVKKLYQQLTASTPASKTVLQTLEDESGSTIDLSFRCKELFEEASSNGIFTLRLAVMDRVARVTSANLLDFDALLEVDGERICLAVESLKNWIVKWKIPRRARQAYRTIIFESMLFVGEKQLFERGMEAFFDLNVVEFVELFSPFAFALQDKESMEQWLANTSDIAMECLPEGFAVDFHSEVPSSTTRDRRTLKNTVEDYFPCNPGNAVRIQL
jgi:hypothetical protein